MKPSTETETETTWVELVGARSVAELEEIKLLLDGAGIPYCSAKPIPVFDSSDLDVGAFRALEDLCIRVHIRDLHAAQFRLEWARQSLPHAAEFHWNTPADAKGETHRQASRLLAWSAAFSAFVAALLGFLPLYFGIVSLTGIAYCYLVGRHLAGSRNLGTDSDEGYSYDEMSRDEGKVLMGVAGIALVGALMVTLVVRFAALWG